MERCAWPADDPLMIAYHDTEWGVPLHDDRVLFEYLILDAAQAGLSWRTILHRRAGYRNAFAGYDLQAVAAFDQPDIERLLQDPGIIRNRLKVQGAVRGAQAALEVQRQFGSLDAYFWQFTAGRPLVNRWATMADVPTRSAEAETMSKDMRRRGFTFCGPTICYAFMQAAGMVNDHITPCFRHLEVAEASR